MAKKQNKIKRTWLIVLCAAAVIAIAAGIYWLSTKKNTDYPISPGPTIEDEGSRRSQSQDQDIPASPGVEPAQNPATGSLAAPSLIKSSGNNGAVPVGAVIEFICLSVDGASCDIVLTNSANPKNVVKLGARTIADNGRGEYAALWNWTAQKGNWKVVAQASKAGASASSSEQTLEVK